MIRLQKVNGNNQYANAVITLVKVTFKRFNNDFAYPIRYNYRTNMKTERNTFQIYMLTNITNTQVCLLRFYTSIVELILVNIGVDKDGMLEMVISYFFAKNLNGDRKEGRKPWTKAIDHDGTTKNSKRCVGRPTGKTCSKLI